MAGVSEEYSYLPSQARDQVLRSEELLRQMQQEDGSDSALGQVPEIPGEVVEPFSQAPADDGWQQKYQVLQGKYNAEIPRLNAEVHFLRNSLSELRQQMESGNYQADGDDNTNSGHESVAPEYSEITKKLENVRDMFGDDSADVNQYLIQKMQKLEQQINQSANDKFYSALTSVVPNWQQVNEDPGFLKWLQQVDPYTGQPLNALLNHAAANLDAGRAITFFRDYLATVQRQTATTPVAPVAPVNSGNGGQQSGQVAGGKPSDKLAELVQPDAHGAGSALGSNPKIWTASEVSKFYEDCTKGAYRGRENEMDRIDREIIQANAEGRIR